LPPGVVNKVIYWEPTPRCEGPGVLLGPLEGRGRGGGGARGEPEPGPSDPAAVTSGIFLKGGPPKSTQNESLKCKRFRALYPQRSGGEWHEDLLLLIVLQRASRVMDVPILFLFLLLLLLVTCGVKRE